MTDVGPENTEEQMDEIIYKALEFHPAGVIVLPGEPNDILARNLLEEFQTWWMVRGPADGDQTSLNRWTVTRVEDALPLILWSNT